MKLAIKPKIISSASQRARVLSYSWQLLEKDVKTIARQIKKNHKFDTLLVMVRGGMVPAIMLTHLLGRKDLAFFQVHRALSNNPHDWGDFQIKNIPPIRRGEKFLLVEDIIFTGKTLNKVIDYILSQGGKITAIASLVADEKFLKSEAEKYPKINLICPHFCRHQQWIRFPWENKIRGEKLAGWLLGF